MKSKTTKHKDRTSRKPRLSAFARNLLEEWRRLGLPESAARLVLAVSGGADSTALMLGLDELIRNEKLQLNLTIAHLDHGLRADSSKDAKWVSRLAQTIGYDVIVGKTNLTIKKASKPENLEQVARKARYKFLQKTADKIGSTFVLTAHTLDDQAETILLRLLRGSAAEGLSGAPLVRELAPSSNVQLIRPLLSWAQRRDTEDYCRRRQVDFRIDRMNDDESFSRVRVRKQLLPLMKSFNNRVVEALSRTAALLNEDAAALSDEARRLLELALQDQAGNSETALPSLNVKILLQAPPAIRRRALREWIRRSRGDLRRVEMVHLVAVEKLLQGEQGGRVAELPGGMQVTRRQGMLDLSRKKGLKKPSATSKITSGRHRRS
jgi:tRNA(Ile)-lysidine synthase